MAKRSTPEPEEGREALRKKLCALRAKISEKYYQILASFLDDYLKAALLPEEAIPQLSLFLSLILEQSTTPYAFPLYHRKIRTPVDYYRFGLDFLRPLIDLPSSSVLGLHVLDAIAEQLKQGENAILLANHQTEPDPQAISILLEKSHPRIAESIIYVAGERVVTDPLAIPFSMGCDLLCIYSKRYIDHPPELKAEKQLHNKKTMELMSRLLQEGGKIIYVAPSGGRDRRNAQGVVEVAPFDAGSIEMCYLMARKAKRTTRFYPLALATYDLFPPPETVQRELGETRAAKRAPIFLSFAPEFDMEQFPGSEKTDKVEKREARARALWAIVNGQYQTLAKRL